MQSLELLEELPSFLSVGTNTAKQKQLPSFCLGIETSQHSRTHVTNTWLELVRVALWSHYIHTLQTLQDFCPGGITVKPVSKALLERHHIKEAWAFRPEFHQVFCHGLGPGSARNLQNILKRCCRMKITCVHKFGLCIGATTRVLNVENATLTWTTPLPGLPLIQCLPLSLAVALHRSSVIFPDIYIHNDFLPDVSVGCPKLTSGNRLLTYATVEWYSV